MARVRRRARALIAKVEPITTARSLRGPFDYVVEEGAVAKGSLVVVPFGRRDVAGVVVGVTDRSDVPAEKLVGPRRVRPEHVPAELVDLAEWMAREYVSTFARALQLVMPPTGARAKEALWAEPLTLVPPPGSPAPDGKPLSGRQREALGRLPGWAGADLASLRRLEARGLVRIGPRGRRRAPEHVAVGARGPRPALTAAQREALDAIVAAADGEQLLLHGVTGSGKTEVYLGVVEEELRRGRGAIVLVPEIALTPQIVGRFVDRFGDTVAVLHSKLSKGERYDEWRRLRSGEARVCVGPRSAVFAPIERLGVIVVDEEHDPSYKHEGDPRYDARLVAERRGAKVVFGSATPRPESASLRRLRLPERVDGRALPPVEVLDMRGVRSALHPDTAEALHRAGKAIVLLNRRGWSNFLTCQTCGHVWMCPECDVSLVLHRAEGFLACHHCGHREGVPQVCGECRGVSIGRHGAGTERLEAELAEAGLRVWRLDADVARPAQTLRAFDQADGGVLVGTQMVAKGHDFPDVTLGVVLDADATLRFPDFRAEERTFALVAQLAGRAGRGAKGGRVVVQTIDPAAASIAAAARHDADGFLEGELARRRALSYPPYSSLVRVVCSSVEPGEAHAAASTVRDHLELAPGQVLGPAPLFRVRGRERAQLVLKSPPERRAETIEVVGAAVEQAAGDRRHRAAAFSVDVDPQ